MAGPTRDAGWPDISSTSASKFIPQIWSGKLDTKFYATTMFGECANTDYEGEIKAMGDTVIIRTVPDITISDYVIGAGLNFEKPVSPAINLDINKAKAFAFDCNDVEEVQGDINKMDAWSDDATHQMRVAIDTDVLANIYTSVDAANAGATAGAISASFNMGALGGNSVQLTKLNIIDFLVDVRSVLGEQNVPDEECWVALPTWACGLIKKSDLKDASLSGDAKSILRTGVIGSIDGLNIFRNNNVANEVDSTFGTVWNIVAGHKKGLTFASQMTKVEVKDNPNDFGQRVCGLNVFGYKVTDGKKLVHGIIQPG